MTDNDETSPAAVPAASSAASSAAPGTAAQRQPRALIRVPKTAVLVPLLVILCVTPMALALPVLSVLYAVPVGFIVWLLRTETVVDTSGLVVRTVFRTRSLAWDDLSGLTLTGKSKVRAVLGDGTEVALPAVRTRHLPVLSSVSGGRIDDPTERRETGEH
ncbi:PH domain-containing protein [Haloechinothrix alba]|uniref:PH domain-containing protein n=1 Tax=Haloechinothrix alba TaxID=664784 RepID=UPI001595DAA1|nr:PH domain-containing protein [Haloechinothrix alba]